MQATPSIWRAWGARAAVIGLAGLVVACASHKPPPEPVLQGAPAGAQMGPPEPAAPSAPPSAAAQAQAQKEAQAAVEELEDGHEDEARALLRKAMGLDPNNKLALSLLRQLNLDPLTLFGRESFSYTVKPGESLSKIAGHYMGDIYLFYGLARYNDIKVPKQLAGGQVIRVPGRAPAVEEREPARPVAKPAPKPARQMPPAAAAPAPMVQPAAPVAPVAPPAPALAAAASVPAPAPSPAVVEPAPAVDTAAAAKAKAEAQRKKLIEQHTQKARASLARQDLDGAIANWSKVLELDPGNDTARLERQKAITLKEKVKALQ